MPNLDRLAAETRERYPHPGDDPIARLAHVVGVFADTDPNGSAVIATRGVYGQGVETGLTHGDLRAINDEIKRLRRHLDGIAGAAEEAATDFLSIGETAAASFARSVAKVANDPPLA